jgi:hypothetical protein
LPVTNTLAYYENPYFTGKKFYKIDTRANLNSIVRRNWNFGGSLGYGKGRSVSDGLDNRLRFHLGLEFMD